jgi:hypothetical protein
VKRISLLAGLAVLALSGCGNQTPNVTSGARHILTMTSNITMRSVSDSTSSYIRLNFKDLQSYFLPIDSRIRTRNSYISFRGKGYYYSYPLSSLSSAQFVSGGSGRRAQLLVKPVCLDPSGTCCDAFIGCYSNDPGGPEGGSTGDEIITVDFRLGGGSEVCQWDITADSFADCQVPTLPNTGDGWKGNVVKDFTWSARLQEATVDCNPASIISSTQGAMEYTELRAGQSLPAFSVRDTGVVSPNTEVVVHFTPALSARSQVASLFTFVWPSVGPAASCNAAPPRTI